MTENETVALFRQETDKGFAPYPFIKADPIKVTGFSKEGELRWRFVRRVTAFAVDPHTSSVRLFPLERRGFDYWEADMVGEGPTLAEAGQAFLVDCQRYLTGVQEEIEIDRAWREPLVGSQIQCVREYRQSNNVRVKDGVRSSAYLPTVDIPVGAIGRVVDSYPGAIVVEWDRPVLVRATYERVPDLDLSIVQWQRQSVAWRTWDSHVYNRDWVREDTPYFRVVQV